MTGPAATTAVFVHRTLMPGHLRWPAVEHYVVERREATVAGRLYDTGADFPAAVFGGDGSIDGWVLVLEPSQAATALQVLDAIEGALYRQVVVMTAAGERALAYEWVGDLSGLDELPGRWTGV